MLPQFFFPLFHFSCYQSNMARSDSSVHGRNHGDEEPPVARAELHQLGNSLLEAMERMFNERLPAAGGRGPHQEESGDENSGFGNGFHDRFGKDRKSTRLNSSHACLSRMPSSA